MFAIQTFFFLFALNLSIALNFKSDTGGKIVGGVTVSIKDYPYQLSLEFDGEHVCGAAIVSKNSAVTAAHCLKHLDMLELYTVRAGSSIQGASGDLLRIKDVYVHPDFRNVDKDNDVAVLTFQTPLKYREGIKPVQLGEKLPPAKTKAVATGWGSLMEGGATSYNLQAVTLPLVPNIICKTRYRSKFTENMFCAGDYRAGGKDSCQGDSGGPLVYKNQLIGIVSFGAGCGRRLSPGVYTNIPKVLSFIKQHVIDD